MKMNNELIAEFMGLPITKLEPEFSGERKMKTVPFMKWQYDTSWEWLMPVVEKIKDFSEKKSSDDAPNTIRISHSHVHIYIDATGFQSKWKCSILGKLVRLRVSEGGFNSFEDLEIPHITIYAESDNRPIIPTYKAVVEFIKWYNAQKLKSDSITTQP